MQTSDVAAARRTALATALLTAGLLAHPGRPLSADHGVSVLRLEARLALVRQRRRGQRRDVRRRARHHRAARAERRRQDDPAAHDGRLPGAERRHASSSTRRPPGAIPSSTGRVGFVPEREAVYRFLTGPPVRERRRAPAGGRRPGGGHGPRHRLVDLHDAAGPRDRRLLEGHAAAGEGGGRARPRPVGPHPRRAVQRHGPASAAPHDGPAARRWPPRGARSSSRSHILEEVERLSDRVLVVVAGRLAASGDFRRIRRLMTDRPHSFTLRSTDDRRLARELLAHARRSNAVELHDGVLTVRTGDYGALTRRVAPGRATRRGVAPRAAAGRRVARIGLQLPRAPMTAALVSITLRSLLNRRRTLLLALLGRAARRWSSACIRLGEPFADSEALEVTRTPAGRLRDRRAPAARGGHRRDLGAGFRARGRHDRVPAGAARAAVADRDRQAARGLGGRHLPPRGTGDRSWPGSSANGDVAARASASRWPRSSARSSTPPIFVALSLITSRALIVGLAYVVVWEGVRGRALRRHAHVQRPPARARRSRSRSGRERGRPGSRRSALSRPRSSSARSSPSAPPRSPCDGSRPSSCAARPSR